MKYQITDETPAGYGPDTAAEQAAPEAEARKIVPPEVKRSTFGCTNCLWASCECKAGSKYRPEPDFKDCHGKKHATCGAYTYYD